MTAPQRLEAPPEPQPVLTPLTEAAIFLVVTVDAGRRAGRQGPARRPGRPAAVGRLPGSRMTRWPASPGSVAGLGPAVRRAAPGRAAPVPRAARAPAPRPSPPPATCCSTSGPGGWTCASSWPRQVMDRLAGAVTVADEVHGFRYFDERDLLGFVDGTENPAGRAAAAAVLIGAGGPGVRRRQLRHRPEVPARPGRLERADRRGAGAGDRPHQAGRHRAARRRQAGQLPRRAEHDHRSGRRRAADRRGPTCRSARPGAGEFGTYFIGYSATPERDRADAEQHVPRQPARQLRPDPGLLHRGHRHAVLRAVAPTSSTTCPTRRGRTAGRSGRGCAVVPVHGPDPRHQRPTVRWASAA